MTNDSLLMLAIVNNADQLVPIRADIVAAYQP